MKSFQLTLSILLLGLSFQLFAGNAPTSIDSTQKALVFTHQYRSVKKYLTVGERVKIRLKNQLGLKRGKITQITDSTLTIERGKTSQTIPLSEIELIQKTTIGNIIASVFGVYAMVSGVVSGAALIAEFSKIGNDGWSGLLLPFILIFLITTLAITFVGTLPFWVRAKRFNLGKQIWKMEVKKIYRNKYGKIKDL